METSVPIIENIESSEIKELVTGIPKAIGSNHFLNEHSFLQANKHTSRRIGGIMGVRYVTREFMAYLRFWKSDSWKLAFKISIII